MNDIAKSAAKALPRRPVTRSSFSKRSLHGITAAALGRAIVNGEIAEEALLPPEPELTQKLDCSRSVLREAILVLTAKGLLESRQKLGTRVRPRVEWNLLDPDVIDWALSSGKRDVILQLVDIRIVVEPALAGIAAERGTSASIAEIETALLKMEATVGQLEDFIPHDLAFHDNILKASGNEFLSALGHVVRDAVLTVMVVTQIPENLRRTRLKLHRAVYEAIAERDAPRAVEAMRVLVQEANDDLLAGLKQRRFKRSSVLE